MVHSYVFIRSATQEGIARIGRLTKDKSSGVRFAASLSGEFDALVAVDAPSVQALEGIVHEHVRGFGIEGTHSYIALTGGAPGKTSQSKAAFWIGPHPMPVWARPKNFLVFSRCEVEPGAAPIVMNALARLPHFMGATMIAGDFDILFEASANKFEDLMVTLQQLHGVFGLRSSSSGFAAGTRYWRASK